MWHSKFRQIHFLMKNINDKCLILHLKGTDTFIWKSFVLCGRERVLGWLLLHFKMQSISNTNQLGSLLWWANLPVL